LNISCKSHETDFATAIDLKNENFIASEIKKHFPEHEIIGEESTGTGTIPPLTNKPTWIIDPIDGTTNFAAGLPLSCVSIGFCLEGKPFMGVVYAPMTQELYIAVKGLGAYRNGVPLLKCTGEKASKSLSNSVVCFEFGYARTQEGIDNMVNAVRRLLEHGVRTTRTLGSGVLDLCYVACGRMDVVYTGMAEEGWKPWDYCAGLVVAMEAGCNMSHLMIRDEKDANDAGALKSGYEFNLYSSSMICGVNEEVVDQCRKVVVR
jgi:fructose-1,6-bisphosphatase/inositol monophosphatase family enzyme